MKRTAILAFCLAAVLSGTVAGQSGKFQSRSATDANAFNDNGLSRPRIVGAKAAEVRSSVVVNTASVERMAFDLLNKKREEKGLRSLVWSDDIAVFARQHSQNMAELKFFSHRGLDNTMVSDRADRAGLRKWRSIGENIAFNRGYKDPVDVAIRLWLESPSHRRNLLNDEWRESAIGIAITEDGSYYFTQVFLLRK